MSFQLNVLHVCVAIIFVLPHQFGLMGYLLIPKSIFDTEVRNKLVLTRPYKIQLASFLSPQGMWKLSAFRACKDKCVSFLIFIGGSKIPPLLVLGDLSMQFAKAKCHQHTHGFSYNRGTIQLFVACELL